MKKKTLFDKFYELARLDFKSDSQMARAIGVSRGTFNYYTKKENPRSPNISTLERWCVKLDIEIRDNVFFKK